MREEDVRGVLARTLDTPPVPATGTDAIIAEGRRMVRRRRGFAYTGVTAAVLAAVVGVGAVLQPGTGGLDGADSSPYWDPSGVADVNYEYDQATLVAIANALPGGEVEDINGSRMFDWNAERTAIVAELAVHYENEDTQRLTITVQEPRPDADVDQRLKDLAGCAEDCTLTDTDRDRRLLTRLDRFDPDDFGPRNREQALVARTDGTIVTAAAWAEDDSPGTVVLTADKLAGIAQHLPEIAYAPVGTVSSDEASASYEAPPVGDSWAGFLDKKLENGISSILPDAVLTDDIDSPDKVGYRADASINGYRSHGTIVLPVPPNMNFTAETYGPVENPFDTIEELAGCAEVGGCSRTDITDSAYFTAVGPDSIAVWAVRDSGLIARLTVEATEDAPLPLTPEEVLDIVRGIPAPTN